MKNTTAVGMRAEDLAAQYLVQHGYEILQRNFKNRFSELDIIAKNTEYICCIEVKYRNSDDYGGGLGAISADKKSVWLGASSTGFTKTQRIQSYSHGSMSLP